jgi:hypothetical protein
MFVNTLRVDIMIKQTLTIAALMFAASAVNAAQITLTDTQTQIVDSQDFVFNFNTSNYEAGTSSVLRLTVQGDFDDIPVQGTAGVNIEGSDYGSFHPGSAEAKNVSFAGFSNFNTYKYSVQFLLDADTTAAFLADDLLTVGVDFSDEVQHLCGWFNFSNCTPGQGVAPFARVDFTYSQVSNVPVPAAVWLFGSALFGLAGIARRKKVQ